MAAVSDSVSEPLAPEEVEVSECEEDDEEEEEEEEQTDGEEENIKQGEEATYMYVVYGCVIASL